MKPRFSILTLLGITAYVALVVAAIITPTNHVVNAIAFYCWGGGMAILVAMAAQTTSGRVVFARGCLFGTLLYLAVVYKGFDTTMPGVEPPNVTLFRWLYDRVKAMPPPPGSNKQLHELWAGEYIHMHTLHNCSLAFGLLGGSVALWYYQRQQQRANQEKSK